MAKRVRTGLMGTDIRKLSGRPAGMCHALFRWGSDNTSCS